MLRLSNFLSAKSKADRPKLTTVGLDQCGRSVSAFNALENWRLEELIGMGIRDTELYKCALTHPAAVKPSMRFKSYERLEYLGDAVLELAMRDILLERIPEADEGILTFQCQALTKGDSIRVCAAWLGLDKWILTNVFSMKQSLLQSPSVLGDAFEALVGAIYKDKGLSAAKGFVIRVFSQCPFTDFDRLTLESNYHTELSRKLSSLGYTVPMYITLDARQQPVFPNGPAAVLYTEQVYVNGRLHGIGRAYDQRIAQQFAAKSTLQTAMRWL
jgi:ribonuclease-3